jgi:glycosyltransferase involved in cell wall biosynthesis
MISFIMPAKNVSLYVGWAVDCLCKADYKDWELVVIDDHSTDITYEILKQVEETDSRIKVFKNKGNGKVVGLNYGYSLTSGEIIKCIDADDALDAHFFDHIGTMHDFDAMCHDFYITTNDLKIIGHYAINKTFLQKDFIYCLKYLKAVPRCTWSFTREIGDRIFPMPTQLPFEDVWFSLVIKKYAHEILHLSEKLYYYRQHKNQTYGGILNFDSEVISFRANRMLRFIEVLQTEEARQLMPEGKNLDYLKEIRFFYNLLASEKLTLRNILASDISKGLKLKLLLYRKFPIVAPLAVRLNWLMGKFIN